MTRSSKPFRAIALGAMAFLSAAAYADNKDVVDYRQDIMKTLGEQSGALGQILSTVIPPDNAAAHIEAIALAAQTALKAFQPNVPGGQAKPEVWANWADFAKRMNDFAQAMTKQAQVAKTHGADAAMQDILTPLGACKECHDKYRSEKKDSQPAP